MKIQHADADTAHRQPAAVSGEKTTTVQAAQGATAGGLPSLQAAIDRSPRMVAQRRTLQAAFGSAVQLQADGLEDDEPLQERAAPALQRVAVDEDDEGPLQGRFDAEPVQRNSEEADSDGSSSASAGADVAPVNETGMPNQLKAGIEALSGMDMSGVRVHRNSEKPAQLNALAYAQGTDIHLGPGQEQHLPHEAWHVVQQRQGRVQATMQMAGVGVNDDVGLDGEADLMGERAESGLVQLKGDGKRQDPTPPVTQWTMCEGSPPTPLAGAVQRKIVVADKKVNRHDLAAGMGGLMSDVAERHLKPLLEEWQKAPGDYPTEAAANFTRLRTELVIEWTRRQADALKSQLPKLYAVLPENQFNTLVYMSSLQAKFSATPLEQAYTAALASKRISSASLATVFSPGKLPATPMGYAVFAEDWSARNAGVQGLTAELHVAGSIKHEEVMHKATIGMGQEMQTGVVTAAGPEIQDADVSFMNVSGQHVLVEVAATIARLYNKMGADGADQRARYEQLVQVNPGRVLAYAVPGVSWTAFFVGVGNEVVATRAAGLGIGWGLIIDGHYADPMELNAMHAKMAAALPHFTDFWSALSASHLGYSEVQAMTADNLQKRLQRHVPIVAAPSSSSRKEKGRAKVGKR